MVPVKKCESINQIICRATFDPRYVIVFIYDGANNMEMSFSHYNLPNAKLTREDIE